mmetsp:Transcript_1992/g.7149  ORF Transcript_1992/g.7149 Transcript_1992/m.7149 type:complete len:116 (-) Transcript_1992:640-987(-)|eukprot:CAMPEP_0117443384 /NCGR_PEP_ID=MMETSP0759-20121206/4667_1 /TAXON_ID=63605 /ORGANISM="Percolomonas cosmopolitus, Strain WS" /LENGTH=115 /DNA_ID=CAMNT_0005235357 /DNA_START=303 /DNA_END=650 /DNA_ORIENTATION=+
MKLALQLVLAEENDENAALTHFRTQYNGCSFSARSDERMYTSQLFLYALHFIAEEETLHHMGVITERVSSEYALAQVNSDFRTLFKVPNQVVKKMFSDGLLAFLVALAIYTKFRE